MRKYVKAAESDYIKIGNMILPRDMSNSREYESFEETARRTSKKYKHEKEQEAIENKRQEAIRRGQKLREAVEQAIAENTDIDNPLHPYFEVLVPSAGPAETVAGELVRAMMRLLYRDWNDGDVFYSSYGLETCGSSAQYLMDVGPSTIYDTLFAAADNNAREDDYTEYLNKATLQLIEYLDAHPELYGEENTVDSRDYPYDGVAELIPRYDYDFEIPENVLAHIEEGHIDSSDIEWEVKHWEPVYRCDCDVYVNERSVEILDMTEDEYEELEGHGYEYLENYGHTLDDEYGVPYDDEWDEDDEDW